MRSSRIDYEYNSTQNAEVIQDGKIQTLVERCFFNSELLLSVEPAKKCEPFTYAFKMNITRAVPLWTRDTPQMNLFIIYADSLKLIGTKAPPRIVLIWNDFVITGSE